MNEILELEIGFLFGLLNEKNNQSIKGNESKEEIQKGNANTLMKL